MLIWVTTRSLKEWGCPVDDDEEKTFAEVRHSVVPAKVHLPIRDKLY